MRFPSRRSRMLDVQVTYLQMRAPGEPPGAAPDGVEVRRAEQPTVSFYRYLYAAVGSPWMWFERRRLNDVELTDIIGDERVEIQVVYRRGVPAGYAELDRRQAGETEIAYFGLMPEFIGQGLGRYFIRWAVARAWAGTVNRVWLHTCSLDHPRAVDVYRSAGLQPYRHESVSITDPRTVYDNLG